MQKEIERNLNLRNEIRHRIITADSAASEKKRAPEGLKYLVSERENNNYGLASLSTSTSSSTSSSLFSAAMKKEMIHTSTPSHHHQSHMNHTHNTTNNTINMTQHEEEPKAPVLRPASFLTGFSGFGSSETGFSGGSFITRGIPPRTFSSISSKGSETPSISTRFFQRLASRLDEYDKKNHS